MSERKEEKLSMKKREKKKTESNDFPVHSWNIIKKKKKKEIGRVRSE